MKLILCSTFLAFSLTTCYGPKQLSERIDRKFRTEYIGQLTYGKKIEKRGKKILMDFYENYRTVESGYTNDKSPLYIIENVYEHDGNFDNKNIRTYFWENDKLIEVYIFDGYENKLEKRQKEYWGIEHSLPTIKTIVEKIKSSESESLNELHSKAEFQLSHSGTYYVTVVEYDGTISHTQKFEEFMIPSD